jgi:hypothetical protein
MKGLNFVPFLGSFDAAFRALAFAFFSSGVSSVQMYQLVSETNDKCTY